MNSGTATVRIPLFQKLAYAIGMLVNNLQAAALPAMMVILVLGLKVDPLLVGVIGFVPRIFDAVSDPLMGYISDNSRTPFGRRRPFIFMGALLAGLVFAVMWQVPSGYSESFYFWIFLCASVIYFLVYTVYATPFVAFGYEMTPDYHERTRLHAFANTFGLVPWIIAPWFYRLMDSDRFVDTVAGARYLALWVGGTIAVLGVIPAIFCREDMDHVKSNRDKDPGGLVASAKEFFQGIRLTLRCKPFIKLCAATFLVFNGFQLGISFSLFVMIYYVFGGDGKAGGSLNGWFGMLTAAFTFGVIPLTALISSRIGKRETFLVTISLSIVGYAMKWVGYNPEHPYWLLASCPLIAFGTGSLFTLMGSMVADVCDLDELQTGERREGVFGAIYWWMVKVGMAIAGLLSGWLLNLSGFDVNQGVTQSPESMLFLRLFDVCIPIVASVIALGVMLTYGISESRANEIRDELTRRREGASESPEAGLQSAP